MNKDELLNKLYKLKRYEVSAGVLDFMSKTAVKFNHVLALFEQLDEPEVLSQEWINSNSINASSDGVTEEYVHVDDLENLIIPKRELPVIPKYVAEYLDFAKSDVSLMRVLEIANRRDELPKWEKEYDWISVNDEAFARAWLDGYEIEKEKLYYIKFSENQYAQRFDGTKIDSILVNDKSIAAKFTKEEIKKMNENFMALAVEETP